MFLIITQKYQLTQPLDVVGVDITIQQFGYFPQVTLWLYLSPPQPPLGFISFLTLLVSCILTSVRGCRQQDVAISCAGWALTSHMMPDAVPVTGSLSSAHSTSAEALRLTWGQRDTPAF